MWELAIGVVTYLTKALGRSRVRPERLFRDHVAPIQEDLLLVQKDYTRSFAELGDLIADESVPTKQIAAHVNRQRKKLNPVRVATSELAKALTDLFAIRFQKKEPPKDSAEWLLNQYADAVIDYLYGTFDTSGDGSGEGPCESEDVTVDDIDRTIGTRYSGFMKAVREAQSESCERSRLSQMVRETERELDRSWAVLAHRYGVLKAKCLI